jgi:peptidoglycan/LPS O-acetylase OafA/YrhL
MGEQTRTEKRPRLNTLEGLRFLATLHLFIFHYGQPFLENLPKVVQSFFGAGYYSTSIFFILSGFILTYVYIDRDCSKLRISTRRFYLKRLCRLYPYHLVGFALIVLPYKTGASTHSIDTLRTIYNLFLIHAWIPDTQIILSFNQVSWSASALIFFYLMFPAIIRLTTGCNRNDCKQRIVFLWGMTLCVSLLPGILFNNDPYICYIFHFNPMVRIFEFGIGVLAGKYFLLQKKQSPKLWRLTCVILINLVFCSFAPFIQHVWVLIGLFAIPQVVLIYLLVSDRSFFIKIFSFPLIRTLGQSSIAFYFLHGPLFPYVRKVVQILHWERWYEPESSISGWMMNYQLAFKNKELILGDFIIIGILLFTICILLNRIISSASQLLYNVIFKVTCNFNVSIFYKHKIGYNNKC